MNFPVIMLGEFQETEIDLDVIFSMKKFCGGSSGAETHSNWQFMETDAYI